MPNNCWGVWTMALGVEMGSLHSFDKLNDCIV